MPSLTDLFELDTDLDTFIIFAVRAVVVFGITILYVRLGGKRIFDKNSAFDIVAAIMLGSIMSRAITDSAPFLPTLAAGALLVATHRFMAYLSYKSDQFGNIIKGVHTTLVRDGQLLEKNMSSSHITEQDLLSAARTQARIQSLEDIQAAYLERSGDISIIPKEKT
ncbi:DUF421 domain-containing protein [Cesiribacter andamanensis]|uniref:YetF C-terminal domain-containing protein n=1 Tax=Cesiribacter andamanensis AMV16 TaxID=1279009 RepID=M7NQ98_9BACT|nr:YetF domain-containing protein [Cesiribacter andamanensis]EMR00694.1 hypothetical protein ADICEAN_04184 [Cesiribacter andamanensis AMV16]